MKFLLLALPALALLSGCDSGQRAAKAACIAEIKSTLRAPSTLSIVKISYNPIFERDAKTRSLSIEFDAMNSAGVPIRDTKYCVFDMNLGKLQH